MVLTLLANVDTLQHELLWYKRHLFGRRSEKLDSDQQMLFDLLEQKIRNRPAKYMKRRIACPVDVSGFCLRRPGMLIMDPRVSSCAGAVPRCGGPGAC